jgi:transcription antitermination factor NusG
VEEPESNMETHPNPEGPASSGEAAGEAPLENDPAAYARWHVLHTKSRQEKALARDLLAFHIEHYLPLVRRTSFFGQRKVYVRAPLFPGYVFVRSTLDDAYRADRTKRVAKIIRVSNQAQLEWELANIRKALDLDAPLVPCDYLVEGMRVVVRAGPFAGIEGFVLRHGRPARIVLQIDAFGKAVSLEIDADLLDRIE